MADGPPNLAAVASRATVPVHGALVAHWAPCPATWAALACALPAGHRATEHYDRARQELWLHPDDWAPAARG